MTARTQQTGFAGERLARIDAHLKRSYVDPGKIAGALTLVCRRGEIAHFSPLGLMDRERGVPMAEDTIFRIYSMTKPITSVALMMLYEHGHFQLDDPVHRWIPAWRNLRVYVGGNHPQFVTEPCLRPMTVRDLLTHTSGLSYGFMERTNVDRAYRKLGIGSLGKSFSGDLAEMVQALAGLPLEFSPGAAWNYSVSTDVVGHLVELLSGERFDEYLRRHVFEPLGMVDTGFFVRPTVFADVKPDMRIFQEEIFGPVLCMTPFRDEEHAIELANATEFGLSGYVQSADEERARRVAGRMRTGMVHLNGAPTDGRAPFGGYRQSGNGREWGRFGLEDYLEVKAVMGWSPQAR